MRHCSSSRLPYSVGRVILKSLLIPLLLLLLCLNILSSMDVGMECKPNSHYSCTHEPYIMGNKDPKIVTAPRALGCALMGHIETRAKGWKHSKKPSAGWPSSARQPKPVLVPNVPELTWHPAVSPQHASTALYQLARTVVTHRHTYTHVCAHACQQRSDLMLFSRKRRYLKAVRYRKYKLGEVTKQVVLFNFLCLMLPF